MVTDCDTYGRRLRRGYGYRLKIVRNYTCHPGPYPRRVDRVPRGCPSHRGKAKLKRSRSAARTDYVDYNDCSCKDTQSLYVYQGDRPEYYYIILYILLVFISYVRILM